MTSTFELFSGVRETVGAWEECEWCKGIGKWIRDEAIGGTEEVICIECNGAGGKWSDAYKSLWADEAYLVHVNEDDKLLFLTRTHEVCGVCKGKGYKWHIKPVQGAYNITRKIQEKEACECCLKDSDGNPTGAEQGTASEWEVKR